MPLYPRFINKFTIKFLNLFFLCAVFSSCTTLPKLSEEVNNNPLKSTKIAVVAFGDARPNEEYWGEKFVNRYIWETNQKSFHKNIGLWVSTQATKTLRKDFGFVNAEAVAAPVFMEKNLDYLRELDLKGFDVAIMADVSHLHGYVYEMTRSELVTVSFFRNLFGFFIQNAMDPKNMGGDAGYNQVKVIECKTQNILWQGDFRYVFDEQTKVVLSPKKYAYQALDEVNQRLGKKIKEVLDEKSD